ncbi:unnamed protein product [Prorocentrum cordatum]|uniref:DUF4326 domain-containing protein n=1 Tax=Prorocentrum cordatum TaxID=2364126 RepID=A0ABN9VZN3_9DINO|nr:unnamed protein product [Polarella glacialis]
MTGSEAKADPGKYEALRRSMLGNPFHHWAVAVGLLVAVPSLAELRESARAWVGGRKLWAGDAASLRCGRAKVDEEVCRELQPRGSRRWCLGPSCRGNPFAVDTSCPREDAVVMFAGWLRRQQLLLGRLEELRGAELACHCSQAEACHADVTLAELAKRDEMSRRDPDVSRRLVMYLAMACHSNGADLRADGSSEELGKVYPRQEMDAGIWQRRTARQLIWDLPQRAPPTPTLFCSALAGWALGRGEIAFAAIALAGPHLCLRTGEALGPSSGVAQQKPRGRGVISSPWTKTACQKGARETAALDGPLAGAVVHAQLQRHSALPPSFDPWAQGCWGHGAESWGWAADACHRAPQNQQPWGAQWEAVDFQYGHHHVQPVMVFGMPCEFAASHCWTPVEQAPTLLSQRRHPAKPRAEHKVPSPKSTSNSKAEAHTTVMMRNVPISYPPRCCSSCWTDRGSRGCTTSCICHSTS